MKLENILPLDTVVKFGGDEIKLNGKISAITIRKNTIMYEISYWVMTDLKSQWFDEGDFEVINKKRKEKIGFKTHEEKT